MPRFLPWESKPMARMTTRNRLRVLMACGLLLAACGASAGERRAGQIAYYVSGAGDDGWSGKLAEPNAAKTDGPLATLQRARDAVRSVKTAGPLKEPVTVYLRGGVYRIEEAIQFAPEDSGSQQAPVTYAAYRGERPVISGGRPISGWQKLDGSLWRAIVPGVKEGRWYFHQLFVSGEPGRLDCLPGNGHRRLPAALGQEHDFRRPHCEARAASGRFSGRAQGMPGDFLAVQVADKL